MKVTRLVLLLTGLAAVIALYFARQPDTGVDDTPDSTEVDAGPDIYASGVTFDQLRPDGRLHYRLNASEISQYNADNLTRMSEPLLHLLNPGQQPWDIEARRGYLRKQAASEGTDEDVVFLRESVTMTQLHPTNGRITLRGEAFYIYPDRQYAESSQSVMIDTEVGRTRAAGLRADLASGVLSLKSSDEQRVHTIVLPEQFKKS